MTVFHAILLARFVHFAAVMILFGSLLFPLYALPADPVSARSSCMVGRSTRALIALAILSGLAWLTCTFLDVTAGSASLFDRDTVEAFFLETQFGRTWLFRLLLMAAAAVTAILLARVSGIATLVAGALLVSQAWLGHAAMGSGIIGSLLIANYAVHVLAGAAWVGGLFALAKLLHLTRSRTGFERTLSFAVDRFTSFGIPTVLLIILSGMLNVAPRIDSLHSLVGTDWGRTLLAKVALVLVMIAIAAFNRLVLLPRVKQRPSRIRTLTTTVGIEQGIGLVVVLAAALLGVLPPPE